MTREEVKGILASIEQEYPQFFKNEAPADARQKLDRWSVAFVNEPVDDVRRALLEAMKVCEYPPKMSDIFKQLRARRADALPGAAELFRITSTAARKIRAINELAAYGGYIDASGRKYTRADLLAEKWVIFNALPGPVKEWAVGPDELASMFDREDGDLMTYVYPAFKKAIEAVQAQEVCQLEQLPPGERPCLDALPPAGE